MFLTQNVIHFYEKYGFSPLIEFLFEVFLIKMYFFKTFVGTAL